MRLLLDTQIFIWFAIEPSRISKEAHGLITDVANTPCLSHISLFEIAIKQKIGKLPGFTISIPELVSLATPNGFTLLPVTIAHLAAYDSIPLMPAHRDPFDRLLLATALADGLHIISADEHFAQYMPLVTVIPG